MVFLILYSNWSTISSPYLISGTTPTEFESILSSIFELSLVLLADWFSFYDSSLDESSSFSFFMLKLGELSWNMISFPRLFSKAPAVNYD